MKMAVRARPVVGWSARPLDVGHTRSRAVTRLSVGLPWRTVDDHRRAGRNGVRRVVRPLATSLRPAGSSLLPPGGSLQTVGRSLPAGVAPHWCPVCRSRPPVRRSAIRRAAPVVGRAYHRVRCGAPASRCVARRIRAPLPRSGRVLEPAERSFATEAGCSCSGMQRVLHRRGPPPGRTAARRPRRPAP
jgi:hypothetical protein